MGSLVVTQDTPDFSLRLLHDKIEVLHGKLRGCGYCIEENSTVIKCFN